MPNTDALVTTMNTRAECLRNREILAASGRLAQKKQILSYRLCGLTEAI